MGNEINYWIQQLKLSHLCATTHFPTEQIKIFTSAIKLWQELQKFIKKINTSTTSVIAPQTHFFPPPQASVIDSKLLAFSKMVDDELNYWVSIEQRYNLGQDNPKTSSPCGCLIG